ncbi:hypothetical protein, conserved [Trypanosoma brucei gambiense DAL972]|nr:hypothetical protein, conserved [Trypanosoma brucei gambiense DAL972]RHW74054.1 TPR repeat/Tetratricopeptide repeat [Trypanosoma brucei equiperdum]CBH09402.1 hypothetical protein, conserved [Trypanosoma brucei gambiense DAL972]|eukprot:XP_011771708.1 hypothetical protein, conserved [Trypanosoma brucei gambiense DAL972]
MAAMSEEHLAFMRSMGITTEDILDPPAHVGSKSLERSGSSGPSLLDNYLDADMCKTTKAVILPANGSQCKKDSFLKKVFAQNDGPKEAVAKRAPPEQLKDEGNKAFEEGRYRDALLSYSNGIDALLESDTFGLKEYKSRNVHNQPHVGYGAGAGHSSNSRRDDPKLILLAALFSNRSACYLQAAKQIGTEEAFECALRDADRAVELRPVWFKGYSRQGDVLFKMKKYSQAVEAYAMALQFDPGNNNLLYSLREARQRCCSKVQEDIRLSKQPGGGSPAAAPPPPPLYDTTKGNGGCGASNVREGSMGRRAGGEQLKLNARKLWSELKHEVEASVNQPTGDNYRLEQLRLYREQKEREKNGCSSSGSRDGLHHNHNGYDNVPRRNVSSGDTSTFCGKASSTKLRLGEIPQEFSSDAAAAYQQRLLEDFRRRKAR